MRAAQISAASAEIVGALIRFAHIVKVSAEMEGALARAVEIVAGDFHHSTLAAPHQLARPLP